MCGLRFVLLYTDTPKNVIYDVQFRLKHYTFSEVNGNVSKEPRATINPYLDAAGLIRRRLRWDRHPLSWISRRKVKKWKDKYAGRKAVILCNGPSLNSVDFTLLRQACVFTFGLNKINLLFHRTDFRPSVIVAINCFVIEQNADFYNSTKIPLFLNAEGRKWIRLRENIQFIYCGGLRGLFARDCSMAIGHGNTVTYVAMQLAFHMGFREVALVGCDHSFATKGPVNKTVTSDETDRNHFDPDYFSKGVKWQLPDLARSELHYSIAKDIFERHGRRIVNCTDGGKLELFERLSLSNFLGL